MVADTDTWEQKTAQAIEGMNEAGAYVKNHNLGFFIPNTLAGEEHRYVPDFIVQLQVPRGEGETGGEGAGAAAGQAVPPKETAGDSILNLLLEVSGQAKKKNAAKVAAARNLWVQAVNNHGGFGRWGFPEISDPWDVQNTIRGFVTRIEAAGRSPLHDPGLAYS